LPLQLTAEDEAGTNGEEIEVTRQDQDMINKFSRLHQRETVLEESLKTKQVCVFFFRFRPQTAYFAGLVYTDEM